jgi:VWFA-related protein
MRTLICACAVLACGLGFTLDARQGQPFRSSVQTVPIYATVVDAAGRLIPDLDQPEFEVLDNLKKQDITIFKTDVQPISVVVMLDTSGSMTGSIDLLKVAAEKFVIRLLPTDKARIGSFSDKINLSATFTNNRDDLVRYLHEEIDYGNPTRLWDAVDVSMTALSHETNRRVVLVFTDGDDTYSRRSLGDVLKRAQAEEYMVPSASAATSAASTRPGPGLKKIAAEPAADTSTSTDEPTHLPRWPMSSTGNTCRVLAGRARRQAPQTDVTVKRPA